MGNSESLVHFNNQEYESIKKQQTQLGIVFLDETFCEEDISEPWMRDQSGFSFLRSSDLSEAPTLFAYDQSAGFKLGFSENHNLLYVFTLLQSKPYILKQIFTNSESQNWSEGNFHPGIFRVRFWECGHSVEVVVDDLFPVSDKIPLVTKSNNSNEMWPLILEKAYAKFLGNYELLKRASLDQILLDMTGGVIECINLNGFQKFSDLKKIELFENLSHLIEDDAGVVCIAKSSESSDDDAIGAPKTIGKQDDNTGILYDCGYLLTKSLNYFEGCSFIDIFKRAISKPPPNDRLFRLRCFSGIGPGLPGMGEWKGAYSAGSKELCDISDEDRLKVGLVLDNSLEFWINLPDFLNNFRAIVICRWPRTSLFAASQKGKLYEMGQHYGSWNKETCGGGLNCKSTFFKNPQYALHVSGSEPAELLISMSQVVKRDVNNIMTEELLPIGIAIFKIEYNRTTRANVFSNCQLIHTSDPKQYRSIFDRVILDPGRFVLITFTEYPEMIGSFVLRLFMPSTMKTFVSDKARALLNSNKDRNITRFTIGNSVSRELVETVPSISGIKKLFSGEFKAATRITLIGCLDLSYHNGKLPPNSYCILACENEDVKTSLKKSNSNPVWDDSFIFYRTKPMSKPICITVMQKKTIGFDDFLGRYEFNLDQCNSNLDLTVPLMTKENDKENKLPVKGSVVVRFQHVDRNQFKEV